MKFTVDTAASACALMQAERGPPIILSNGIPFKAPTVLLATFSSGGIAIIFRVIMKIKIRCKYKQKKIYRNFFY